MAKRTITLFTWIIIILGAIANIAFWPTAKAWVCLAIALVILSFFYKSWSKQLFTLLLWALSASSLWAVFNWFHWLGFLVFILWIVFLIVWFRKEWVTKEQVDILPNRFWIGVLSTAFIFLFLILHVGINLYLSKPFQLSWWNSILFAHISFLFFYPKLLIDLEPRLRKKIFFILPLLIVLLSGAHSIQYQMLKNFSTTLPDERLTKAVFQIGYYSLGINLTIQHCQTHLNNQQWQEAVKFMRAQFANSDIDRFAETLREQSELNDPFFYAMCFGMQIFLKPDEIAIDFSILERQENIQLLTNERLIVINHQEIKEVKNLEQPAIALSIHPNSQQGAILTQNAIDFFWTERPSIKLDEQRVWADIEFFSENKLWVMDGTGQVEQYVLDNQKWTHDKMLFPPLWGEPKFAQDILPFPDQEACYLLDRYGGVHLWGILKETPPDKDLLNYHYHPERPIMRDLEYGGKWSELMLLNSSGWIFFLLSDRPHMQVLFPRGEAMAMEPVFDIDTVYQLHKDGRIVPYILPQGAHIFIDEGFHNYAIQ